MLIDTRGGRSLLNEAAYAILRQEAPEELATYVLLRDRYLADPDGFATSRQTCDEALGFDSALVVQTLTQALLPLLSAMLLHIVTQATQAFQEKSGERAAEWVRSWFRKPGTQGAAQAVPQPQFTQAQLTAIRLELTQIAEDEGRRLGVTRRKITIVQNALLVRLAEATI